MIAVLERSLANQPVIITGSWLRISFSIAKAFLNARPIIRVCLLKSSTQVPEVWKGYASLNHLCRVDLPGGPLQIQWSEENNHIYMTGPAELSFEGRLPGKTLAMSKLEFVILTYDSHRSHELQAKLHDQDLSIIHQVSPLRLRP